MHQFLDDVFNFGTPVVITPDCNGRDAGWQTRHQRLIRIAGTLFDEHLPPVRVLSARRWRIKISRRSRLQRAPQKTTSATSVPGTALGCQIVSLRSRFAICMAVEAKLEISCHWDTLMGVAVLPIGFFLKRILSDTRSASDCRPQGFKLVMRVFRVHLRCGVPGKFLTNFLTDARVRHS